MKVVVKIGTQSILAEDGTLQEEVVADIVRQIAALKTQGVTVILVSSGAVASGRGVARRSLAREYGYTTVDKQLLASLGQHELMYAYSSLFKQYDLLTAQILLTKQDFHTRQHYLNIARLMQEILASRSIIPIINENDCVAIEELMFTDNDELAGLLAAQLGVDKLVILTSVKGVYDRHPEDPDAQVIPVIAPRQQAYSIAASKTTQGRGGMTTKMSTAHKMSALGITTHIAHAQDPDVLLQIFQGNQVGTTILPMPKKSSIKRYLAFSYKPSSGKIQINTCLFDKLVKEEKVLSILPVGIENFTGDFQKGDLIEISGPEGQKVGIGIAKYGVEKLGLYLGQKNKPALIHYDHLHVF